MWLQAGTNNLHNEALTHAWEKHNFFTCVHKTSVSRLYYRWTFLSQISVLWILIAPQGPDTDPLLFKVPECHMLSLTSFYIQSCGIVCLNQWNIFTFRQTSTKINLVDISSANVQNTFIHFFWFRRCWYSGGHWSYPTSKSGIHSHARLWWVCLYKCKYHNPNPTTPPPLFLSTPMISQPITGC